MRLEKFLQKRAGNLKKKKKRKKYNPQAKSIVFCTGVIYY